MGMKGKGREEARVPPFNPTSCVCGCVATRPGPMHYAALKIFTTLEV